MLKPTAIDEDPTSVRPGAITAVLGARCEAFRTIDQLLAQWRDPEPALPSLPETRALRGRLAASKGAR